MPSLFVDAERLRNLNSGLGQVCLHLGSQIQRLSRESRPGDAWNVTFLVPKRHVGIFGPASYVGASWLRRLWIPGRYDVWHCLHQDSVYLPSGSRLVLTIYDMNFLQRADYSKAKKALRLRMLQRRVDRASVVTAGSAHTAAMIKEQLRIRGGLEIRVIPTGVAVAEDETPEQVPPRVATVADEPFFLFVGAIHPRKNLHSLLPVLAAFPEHRLVLAGPDHHPDAQRLRDEAQERGLAGRLLIPGPVDERTKLWLYAHCSALLFPSLSEGFGLPIVEAMTFGKPVFASRLTSLPEVGGSHAFYFESFEPLSMARVIREGLRAVEQAPERRARMKEWARRFNWSSVAAEYWKIYEELAAER